MNTKTIAHRTGRTTAQVNAIARDLDLALTYRPDLRHYDVPLSDGLLLVDMLNDEAESA